jgi:hypothetical protein
LRAGFEKRRWSFVVGRWQEIQSGMEVRTLVTFRSGKFNITQTKPYYINPYSFGDDVAEWMVRRLKEDGIAVEEKLGQEDFGWYLGFRCGRYTYNFVLGFNADGYWLGWLERQRGLLPSLFGARRRGIQPVAVRVIHSILSSSEDISDVRWHFQKDFDALREDLGASTPLG